MLVQSDLSSLPSLRQLTWYGVNSVVARAPVLSTRTQQGCLAGGHGDTHAGRLTDNLTSAPFTDIGEHVNIIHKSYCTRAKRLAEGRDGNN